MQVRSASDASQPVVISHPDAVSRIARVRLVVDGAAGAAIGDAAETVPSKFTVQLVATPLALHVPMSVSVLAGAHSAVVAMRLPVQA